MPGMWKQEWTAAIVGTALAMAVVAVAGTELAARVPPSNQDQAQLEDDPSLYRIARSYFPADEAAPSAKRLFRLTRDQLDLSVQALLPGYIEGSVKSHVAPDPLQTNYEFADMLSFNRANLGGLATWIKGITARVELEPDGVINCPAGAGDIKCLNAGARAFVARAFRGDVAKERADKLAAFYLESLAAVGKAKATAELVEVILKSPGFLFRKEIDAGADRQLVPEQRLQALTYTLADVPPEALGLNVADAVRHFASREATGAVIERVIASKEAREKLLRFFKAWLEVKAPDDFRISRETFTDFTPQIASAMVEETETFLRRKLSAPNPKLSEITLSPLSYASRTLEPFFASPVGALPATQRLGIFTQPAVIASHSGPTNSRPLKRGIFFVRKVMCMEMGDPPKGVDTTIYAEDGKTERERIEKLTAPATCAGCHKVMDPFGFALEGYDALGRWRTTENGYPVDTRFSLDVLDEGAVATKTPIEALRVITSSAMFKQCFARQLFRFYMGRSEEPADDPLLRRMFFEFARNDRQDLMGLLRTLAASERFGARG